MATTDFTIFDRIIGFDGNTVYGGKYTHMSEFAFAVFVYIILALIVPFAMGVIFALIVMGMLI